MFLHFLSIFCTRIKWIMFLKWANITFVYYLHYHVMSVEFFIISNIWLYVPEIVICQKFKYHRIICISFWFRTLINVIMTISCFLKWTALKRIHSIELYSDCKSLFRNLYFWSSLHILLNEKCCKSRDKIRKAYVKYLCILSFVNHFSTLKAKCRDASLYNNR